MPDKDSGRVSDMALLTHIKAIDAETRGAYGWPRVWRELRQRGVRVGKERDDAGQRHSGAVKAEVQSDD
jgi:putative transposase